MARDAGVLGIEPLAGNLTAGSTQIGSGNTNSSGNGKAIGKVTSATFCEGTGNAGPVRRLFVAMVATPPPISARCPSP
ncbi:MAG TPA: hypothetical protein VK277_08420 [Acidimicrobiales bacterium]|nr:hypothetical protein [Acidimicrobiales bacterium]